MLVSERAGAEFSTRLGRQERSGDMLKRSVEGEDVKPSGDATVA
jgi:hypothetical protein